MVWSGLGRGSQVMQVTHGSQNATHCPLWWGVVERSPAKLTSPAGSLASDIKFGAL